MASAYLLSEADREQFLNDKTPRCYAIATVTVDLVLEEPGQTG